MGCNSDCAQLCRLISDSLLPHTVSVTKEKEKNLMIILSQVSKEIRSWENLHNCNPDGEDHGHNCLANIVSVLVKLLTVESQFVRQTTSNLLVLISDLLTTSVEKWGRFLQYLCVCLKQGISTIKSNKLLAPTVEDNELDGYTITLSLTGQGGASRNGNWLTVACVIQVLRSILKCLNQDDDDELMEMYVHAVSCCLMDISWDFLNDFKISEAQRISTSNAVGHGKVCSQKSRFLFLGALLQLLCSLSQQSSFVEDGGGSLDKHRFLNYIAILVPTLLDSCYYKEGDYNYMFGSQYLRHKILMLMVRLSSLIQWECSTLIMWLQLLREYCGDLLHQSISGRQIGQSDSLEGSPFQTDVVCGKVHKICTPHLQRQAIFLFLRCSFNLISLSKETDVKCSCPSSNFCLTHEMQYAQKCCNKKKGWSALSEWLQRHVSTEIIMDGGIYLDKCRTFALSFLRLFIDEDDFLFEVLLQLWSIPFPDMRVVHIGKGKASSEIEEEILYHLSNILNPVQLFHLFLSELQYDHQVLLDYLISKDTGVNCVKYLLRCLRTVSNSWQAFVEYPFHCVETSQSTTKKCKVHKEGAYSCGKIGTPSLSIEARKDIEHCRRNQNFVNRDDNQMRVTVYNDAKECLLSLERSIRSLHEKNLFPYNPAPLLRSFKRFQELCHHEEESNRKRRSLIKVMA
ncbi:uncharacterized protein LOC113289360 [Papaver somniferum]|uniref:uncharacterized protein LOC113289360 n=1 Tax=Papaver somniferum TaxID=3469 RepID=UPI000E6FBA42|nr:uncharacterized protein LOC113289360 [Papaver somniferum]